MDGLAMSLHVPRPCRRGLTLCAVVALATVAPPTPAQGEPGASPREAAQLPGVDIVRGWTTLRGFDCARCHGRDLRGWSAPDLVAAVRDGSRERFEHYLLTGDVMRGMPGYRSQTAVVADLDAIYAYLRARADGRVGPGVPVLPLATGR